MVRTEVEVLEEIYGKTKNTLKNVLENYGRALESGDPQKIEEARKTLEAFNQVQGRVIEKAVTQRASTSEPNNAEVSENSPEDK